MLTGMDSKFKKIKEHSPGLSLVSSGDSGPGPARRAEAVTLGSVALTERGREPGWLLISAPLDQRNNTDPFSKRSFFIPFKVTSFISASST